MRVFRHNVGGGVLGADLHYRSDLEAYHKGNLLQDNFLATPYGGIMRRPPSERIASHGSVTVDAVIYNPNAIRYFDFVYDREARYVVALISYATAQVGVPSFSRFEIFDTDGVRKDMVDCDYAALNFNEISPKQLNDVMYLSHNSYPLAKLVRNGDTDWALESAVMKGGPWLPWNADDTTLSVIMDYYSATETYKIGDVRKGALSEISVTGAGYVFWTAEFTDTIVTRLFLTRLTIASGHGITTADSVALSGWSGDTVSFNKTYSVQAVGETYIDINTGATDWIKVGASYWWTPGDLYFTLPTSFSAQKLSKLIAGKFFVSLADSNIGNALPVAPSTETAYWRKTADVGTITVKSSLDLFTADNVGQKIFMSVNTAQIYSGVFDAASESSEPVAYSNGAVILKTEGGVWGGILALQKSLDGGVTWEDIGTIDGAGGNNNEEITRDIADPMALIRVFMQTYEAVTGGTDCKWRLQLPAGTPFIGTVSSCVDARTVAVFAETSLTALFQTKSWRFGAFSPTNGYPGVVTIHDERLVLGGSKLQPFMVWCSAVNNWEWFADGTLETSPLSIQANADRATKLCWLASKGELLFGTDFNEYSAGARDSDKVISGVNPPKIQVQNSFSSAPIQALLIGEDVIFVQRDKKTLRGMAFENAKWGYAGQNMTIFSPDIAGSGFSVLSVQRSPFPVIWAVTEDDELISFTYDKESNVLGWARHTFSGADVVSFCIIPTDADDSLVICTSRSGAFYMERLLYSNQVFTDDQDGTGVAMTSLIQPTSMAQAANVLEEARYRITKVYLYLKASQGGEVSVDDGVTWTSIVYPSAALFTGKVQVNVNSGNTEKAPLMIRTSGTKPFNLLSIGLDIDRQTTKE